MQGKTKVSLKRFRKVVGTGGKREKKKCDKLEVKKKYGSVFQGQNIIPKEEK